MSRPKEPRFFSTDVPLKRAVTTEAKYLAIFETARPDQLLCDGSPLYLQSRVALPRIAELKPDARIIVSLRDPIDRMVSAHGVRTLNGDETAGLDQALRAELARVRGRDQHDVKDPPQGPYLEASLYGENLQHLFQSFPRDQVLVLHLEDLAQDPLRSVNAVTSFLGLDPIVQLPRANRNDVQSKRLRRAKRSQKDSAPGALARHAGRLFRALGLPGGRAGHGHTDGNHGQPDRGSPTLAPELRAELQEFLRSDLELASTILGTNLVARWWDAGRDRGSPRRLRGQAANKGAKASRRAMSGRDAASARV
jgi:Sulfotransferase family